MKQDGTQQALSAQQAATHELWNAWVRKNGIEPVEYTKQKPENTLGESWTINASPTLERS